MNDKEKDVSPADLEAILDRMLKDGARMLHTMEQANARMERILKELADETHA